MAAGKAYKTRLH